MLRYLLIAVLLATPAIDDGRKDGRRGNKQFENGQHEAAAAAYRSGLRVYGEEPAPGAIHAGLLNNLGSALYEQGAFGDARTALDAAIGMADDVVSLARASYNAGNTAYRAGTAGGQGGVQGAPGASGQQQGQGANPLEEALEYYKRSLLADPTNEDAKYNYEFVKRQLEEQQQQQQDQSDENQEEQEQDQEGDQNSEENQSGDQQNQEEQQQEENQQDGQNQQQDQQQQEQQQQQQEQQMDPNELSRAEAERILQAFQNEEEELLREVLKPQTRPKKVEKDW